MAMLLGDSDSRFSSLDNCNNLYCIGETLAWSPVKNAIQIERAPAVKSQ